MYAQYPMKEAAIAVAIVAAPAVVAVVVVAACWLWCRWRRWRKRRWRMRLLADIARGYVVPAVADNIYKSNPLMRYLGRPGTVICGGDGVEIPIIIGKAGGETWAAIKASLYDPAAYLDDVLERAAASGAVAKYIADHRGLRARMRAAKDAVRDAASKGVYSEEAASAARGVVGPCERCGCEKYCAAQVQRASDNYLTGEAAIFCQSCNRRRGTWDGNVSVGNFKPEAPAPQEPEPVKYRGGFFGDIW